MHVNQKLLKDCRRNKEQAQCELYKICFNTLMSIASRYSTDDQEAVALVNQGFFKIITGLTKYKSTIPFKAWISRIMINTVIDEYRRNKKHREHFIHTQDGSLTHHANDLWAFNKGAEALEAEELLEQIRALPETTGKVFNLYAIDGYSHKEIASMLGMSEGTSKWHLHEARGRLKKFIANIRKQISVML